MYEPFDIEKLLQSATEATEPPAALWSEMSACNGANEDGDGSGAYGGFLASILGNLTAEEKLSQGLVNVLIDLLGAPFPQIAERAANRLKSLNQKGHAILKESLEERLREGSVVSSTPILEALQDLIGFDRARDCSRVWLEEQSVVIHSIVCSSYFELYVAFVTPDPVQPFQCQWLQVSANVYVIAVVDGLADDEKGVIVAHEFQNLLSHVFGRHVTDDSQDDPQTVADIARKQSVLRSGEDSSARSKVPLSFAVGFTSEGDKMDSFQTHSSEKVDLARGRGYLPFADERELKTRDEKRLLAKWVVKAFPLRSSESIILDAGSSCLELWRCLVDEINVGELRFATIYTNNYQILKSWDDLSESRRIRETALELYGSRLDRQRRAFYGRDVDAKLLAETFRPTSVFIGTSGICFSKDAILFGYHGGSAEKQVKELLFTCYAKRRVILATHDKIGFSAGELVDVVPIAEGGKRNAPILLVTTKPDELDHESTREFAEQQCVFKSVEFQRKLKERSLEMHWIVVGDGEDGPQMLSRLHAGVEHREDIVS